MKHVKTITVVLISASLIIGCKKKNTTNPPPDTTTTSTVSPAHVNTMTAKVNGQDWANYSGFFSYGKVFNTFSFGGQSAMNNPYTSIGVGFTYTLGTVSLSLFGPFSAKYTDVNNNSYTSVTGTMNISAFDTTSNGMIKNLKATFSFQSNVVSGQSYSITQGIIDYVK